MQYWSIMLIENLLKNKKLGQAFIDSNVGNIGKTWYICQKKWFLYLKMISDQLAVQHWHNILNAKLEIMVKCVCSQGQLGIFLGWIGHYMLF